MIKLLRIAPELPVADLTAAIAYYEQKLGFLPVMQMDCYAIVERDVAIHLFLDAAGNNRPVAIHIFTQGIDELHAELVNRGAQVTQGIVHQPWGNRDFRVKDPFGNEIKFTEPVEEATHST